MQLLGAVPPGNSVDLAVDLKAPSMGGTYKGNWMLRSPQSGLFGIGETANSPFWVRINAGPTPTPEITEWRGEYFENRKLDGEPVLVRNDEEINFNWKKGSPANEVPKDNFSVKWTREAKFDEAIYRFSIRVDDGARLLVDERLVIDDWKDGSDRTLTVDLWMSKGKHDLRVEYYEHAGEARAHLSLEKISDPSYPDWQAQYWTNRTLDSDWALVRNDPEIDFAWGDGSPAIGIPSDNFSVRWMQDMEFDLGLYSFYAQSDDGIRVYLDDDVIISKWHDSGGSEVYSAESTLTGSHRLKIEYYEHAGDAKIKFWWEKLSPVNNPPEALDDAYSVSEDSSLQVTASGVLGNDADIDGDPLTANLDSGASNGSLTFNGDGSFTYAPNQDFYGTDTFTYKANDGSADSNIAIVTIFVDPVDDTPIAIDDQIETQEDTPITIEVLGNDLGLGDKPVSVVLLDQPESGVAVVVDEEVSYTPDAEYSGSDSFTYMVTDADGDSASAMVVVSIIEVNDPPVAADDSFSVEEDGMLSVGSPGVIDNDNDLDGDELVAVVEIGPSYGTLTLNEDGSFTYLPAPDFNGEDSFSYRATDGNAYSAAATVSITVSPVDDEPIAEDDNVTVEGDTAVDINVLANDTGLGDGSIIVGISSQPTYGTAKVVGNQVRYIPSAKLDDIDSFVYSVTDADGDSATATVTLFPSQAE